MTVQDKSLLPAVTQRATHLFAPALKDGVLTITAPKTASPGGKTITIETPSSGA